MRLLKGIIISTVLLLISSLQSVASNDRMLEINKRIELRNQAFNYVVKKRGKFGGAKIHMCIWLILPCGSKEKKELEAIIR